MGKILYWLHFYIELEKKFFYYNVCLLKPCKWIFLTLYTFSLKKILNWGIVFWSPRWPDPLRISNTWFPRFAVTDYIKNKILIFEKDYFIFLDAYFSFLGPLLESKIKNGSSVKKKSRTYVVTIRSLSSNMFTCSGSLITVIHVMTVAHCIYADKFVTDPKYNATFVEVGILNTKVESKRHYAKDLHTHPCYRHFRDGFPFDIGLITVSQIAFFSHTIFLIIFCNRYSKSPPFRACILCRKCQFLERHEEEIYCACVNQL